MQKAILLSACLIIFSCGNRDKVKKISGRLRNAEKSWIYLQQISEKGDLTIDSVRALGDGSFEMKNPSTSPEFYILRADPTNLIFLILKPGDNVEVNGDAKNLEATYTVRGSRDSELIQKLRSKDRTLSDSLNKSYEALRVENPMDKESAALKSAAAGPA